MTKWEYHIEDCLDELMSTDIAYLNRFGQDGWELINVFKSNDGLYTCIFKRQVQ